MVIPTKNLLFYLFAIYIVLMIFYVFKSGGVQPAHLLFIVIFTTFAQTIIKRTIPMYGELQFILFIVAYTIVPNLLNFIFVTPDYRFLFAPLYYTFNLMIFSTTLALCQYDEYKFHKIVTWACIFAIGIQLFVVLTGFGMANRSSGTFNNPNQLGYWGLMVFIIYAVCNRRTAVNLTDVLFCFAAVLTVMFSLSKAATVSVILACLFFLFGRPNARNALSLLFIVPLGLLLSLEIATFFLGDVLERVVDSSYNRLSKIGQDSDDNLEGRNYDRIWRFPQYLIIGAGEGGYYRFTLNGKNNEIHSSIGTIIFSYGLIGTIIFMTFFLRLITFAPIRQTMYMLPIFAYGITHQGLRSSLFWIYLAILAFEIHKHFRQEAAEPEKMMGFRTT